MLYCFVPFPTVPINLKKNPWLLIKPINLIPVVLNSGNTYPTGGAPARFSFERAPTKRTDISGDVPRFLSGLNKRSAGAIETTPDGCFILKLKTKALKIMC